MLAKRLGLQHNGRRAGRELVVCCGALTPTLKEGFCSDGRNLGTLFFKAEELLLVTILFFSTEVRRFTIATAFCGLRLAFCYFPIPLEPTPLL